MSRDACFVVVLVDAASSRVRNPEKDAVVRRHAKLVRDLSHAGVHVLVLLLQGRNAESFRVGSHGLNRRRVRGPSHSRYGRMDGASRILPGVSTGILNVRSVHSRVRGLSRKAAVRDATPAIREINSRIGSRRAAVRDATPAIRGRGRFPSSHALPGRIVNRVRALSPRVVRIDPRVGAHERLPVEEASREKGLLRGPEVATAIRRRVHRKDGRRLKAKPVVLPVFESFRMMSGKSIGLCLLRRMAMTVSLNHLLPVSFEITRIALKVWFSFRSRCRGTSRNAESGSTDVSMGQPVHGGIRSLSTRRTASNATVLWVNAPKAGASASVRTMLQDRLVLGRTRRTRGTLNLREASRRRRFTCSRGLKE